MKIHLVCCIMSLLFLVVLSGNTISGNTINRSTRANRNAASLPEADPNKLNYIKTYRKAHKLFCIE